MKKFFLIPLLTLMCSVMTWAGNQPAKAIEPVPFQFNEAAPAAKAAAPARMKAEVAEQDILLEYEGFSQHFTSLQAAFNALPENSTPATVTLYSDVDVDYEGSCLKVKAFQRVTLELNGFGIYGTTDQATASVVIENRGNLTINDAVGTGIITNLSANPDVSWSAEDEAHPYPRYANNVINNRGNGVLTINGGMIKNESDAAATYPIDMYDNSTLIVNGGHIYNYYASAIRYFGTENTSVKNITINGGLIDGYCAIWFQVASANTAPKMNLTINGGEIKSTAKAYVNGTSDLHRVGSQIYGSRASGGSYENINIVVTGGTINDNIWFGSKTNLTISGGRFNGRVETYGNTDLIGGIFDLNEYSLYDQRYNSGYATTESAFATTLNKILTDYQYESEEEMEADGYIVEQFTYGYNVLVPSIWFRPWILDEQLHRGYIFKHIGATEEDLLYEVVPANSQTVTEDKTMAEIAQEIENDGEEVSASVIVIDATTEDEHAVVTVTDDIAVEGIVINTEDGKKEGQIVVESGVTLTVGNSGIVSENDELTTVVVKPGGTVIVGNGGVTQDGDATPVEIQSTGTESGVFMVDPNAPTEVAEAPAKVKVYTRAFRNGSIAHWQQMASPVKGDSKNSNKITIKPDQDVFTVMYRWDYPTDSWAMIDELPYDGTYKGFYSTGWETTDEVIKPFAAYDLINNSTNGGVTYEFAGELVGNGDMTLNFPESGFCVFGNSYTAPIDLSTLFAKITNDMAQANIDPCVYMYNSTADRFESVNSLGLWLKELGIMDVAFSQIPPQQAFVMNLLSGNSAQSAVDYATCVWGNPNTNKNTPILAPKRQQAPTFSALLNIIVSDGEATDRVVLVEDEKYSAAYDNGADAQKYMQGAFNIYAVTEAGELAMVAADDIENTELSFKAGNAVNYTMNFNNVEGEFVLVDRLNNAQVAMTEGGTYVFAAQPNSTMEGRFAIVPAAKMPTAIENTDVKANVKGIYTIMGQYVGENFDILPAGAYIVNGVKIIK